MKQRCVLYLLQDISQNCHKYKTQRVNQKNAAVVDIQVCTFTLPAYNENKCLTSYAYPTHTIQYTYSKLSTI